MAFYVSPVCIRRTCRAGCVDPLIDGGCLPSISEVLGSIPMEWEAGGRGGARSISVGLGILAFLKCYGCFSYLLLFPDVLSAFSVSGGNLVRKTLPHFNCVRTQFIS